mmetsp:Transcript_32765/g.92956  ORF Transcript_32765/g.92956 Transcript_32765/m.92956 type:complete len:247 (-) Transcript_32765:56-796(-)
MASQARVNGAMNGSNGEAKARPGLETLLPKAVPEPRRVSTEDGAALLVVALHCLMVQDGYRFQRVVQADPTKKPSFLRSLDPAALLRPFQSEYFLHHSWNMGPYPNLWMLEYTREDAPGSFMLQCSLAKGMLVACGSEECNPNNINMVGLLVSKYVPELVVCRQRSWHGVFENQDALVEAFTEHVLLPLGSQFLRPREVPVQEGVGAGPGASAFGWLAAPSGASLFTGTVVTGVALVAAAWAYRRR